MKRMAGVMAKLRSRRWGITILLLAVLAMLVPAVAYAMDTPPPTTDTAVVMSNQGFQFSNGHFYGGGGTVSGTVAPSTIYSWTLQATKGKHIFEVKVVASPVSSEIGTHLAVKETATEIVLNPGDTDTATFTLACGRTYLIYCELHRKAAFKLTTACPG